MQLLRGSCSLRRLAYFLLVELFITLYVTASKVELSLTKDKPVQSFDASNGVTYTICSTQRAEFDIKSIFHQLVVVVVGPDDHKLPWHSVKGLSTDDSHTYIENLMLPFFGSDEDLKARNSPRVEFTSSFIRDIVSACPSPIFHSTRSKCAMSFSPFGTACVQLRTDKTIRLTATSERQFNPWLPANMFCGLFLLYLSQKLSKSSIFQYTSGVILFVVGGFLVISFFISKRAVFGGRNQPHVTQLTGMSALLAGSYGASTVWFLRSYLRTICLKYAEFALIYMIIMAVLGLSFIRFIRNMDNSKHLLRVCVKWLLRLAGVIFVWKSTASPMLSLIAMGVLLVIYIVYAFSKGVQGKNKKMA